MIDLAILGLLKEQELHGYELRKRLGDLPGARSSVVSFGSLYPALARLERCGLVKAVEANTRTDRAVPSSGSLAGEIAAFRSRRLTTTGGRSKKVYGITPAGDAALIDHLRDPAPTDERTFALKVAFCRHLPADERLALFERRRAELLARAAERRRSINGTVDRALDRYLRTLRERDDASLDNDLAWLDRLIIEERECSSESTIEKAATTEDHRS
jgi:DNA-binding PadR family transcriptional regulator